MKTRLYFTWLALIILVFSLGCNRLFKNSLSPSGLGSGQVKYRMIRPNVASEDMLRMFSEPELWEQALKDVNMFGFYNGHAKYNFPMGGPNTLSSFLNVVPGGAFRWLGERNIKINLEGGSVKPHNCGHPPDSEVNDALESIGNIQANGGFVWSLSMDEPFISGLPLKGEEDPKNPFRPCKYTVEQTAKYVKYYIDSVHKSYPNIHIGWIEPYAYFTVDEIKSFTLALEKEGVRIPFFHLDFDPAYQDRNISADIQELKNFFQGRGIEFGIIIIGGGGTDNETAWSGAMTMADRLHRTIGLGSQDYIIVQSWLDYPPTRDIEDLRLFPNNLPESDPTSLTGFFNHMMQLSK